MGNIYGVGEIGTIRGKLSGQSQVRGGLSIPGSISGTSDYEKLNNKPSIESVELIGNKDFPDLGLDVISTEDLLEILN